MLINNVRELGTRMRDQRLELGLSQAAFAKRVGVSRSWVVQVERGNAGAEIGLVPKALAALEPMLIYARQGTSRLRLRTAVRTGRPT